MSLALEGYCRVLLMEAGENGLSVDECHQKIGGCRDRVGQCLARLVKSGLVAKHNEVYETKSGRKAYRIRYMLPQYYKEEWDEPIQKTERVLERLKAGEVLDYYWDGQQENGYGDHTLHHICTRLWQKGYDVRKRQNPVTKRTEFRIGDWDK